MVPRCHDAKGNAYWYFDGSDGVLYREGSPLHPKPETRNQPAKGGVVNPPPYPMHPKP